MLAPFGSLQHVAVPGCRRTYPEKLNRQRLRPERGAKSPRECRRGWGPAGNDECPV